MASLMAFAPLSVRQEQNLFLVFHTLPNDGWQQPTPWHRYVLNVSNRYGPRFGVMINC
jgi:hypothetical protein